MLTESNFRILAHTGVWGGGGKINDEQKAILRTSADLYRAATGREPDGYGSNGGSVGPLQQIPTPVAQAADKPWAGWGTIVDCMVIGTSVPKFLAKLRVTDDSSYGDKPMASAIVADLLRVQQPLASEVAANYGGSVTATAVEIAAQFPRADQTEGKDWLDMASKEEVREAFSDALRVAPLYKVVRRKATEHDYAYNDHTFIHIATRDAYQFLFDSGFIAVEHGTAPVVEDNLLGFIRQEAARGTNELPRIDDI